MEAKVIDLTKSPSSSPKEPHKPSRILKFTAYIYSKKIRFKVKKSCLPSFTFNPIPNSANLGTSLFSQATDRLVYEEEPWTPKEHEQFLMGLMKYGGGRWNEIAKKFVKNKTARQVERHATSFFINFLEKYLPSTTTAIASASDITALNPNPNNNNNKMNKEGEEDMGPPRTLTFFSNGEASSSNGISEMNTTRTCIAADDNDGDEVDLELRLGG